MKKLKIALFPSNKFEVPYVIGVPEHIKNFKDLQGYIFKVFKLKDISPKKENFEILFDDCRIPDFQ